MVKQNKPPIRLRSVPEIVIESMKKIHATLIMQQKIIMGMEKHLNDHEVRISRLEGKEPDKKIIC